MSDDKKQVDTVKEDKPAEKTFTLTESELKRMLKENAKESGRGLERQVKLGDWIEKDDIKKQNKTARMKLYQEDGTSEFGIVVDWKFFKNEYDENTRQYDNAIYSVTVLYPEKGTVIHNMPLLKFAHINNFETVEIIKTDEKKLVKVHGKVTRTPKSREGYSMSSHVSGGTDMRPEFLGSEMVDLEEVRVETMVTVKRPSGEELRLNSDRLNA